MRRLIAALTVAAALSGAASSELIVQGVEFQVNTTAEGGQYGNAVAGSASGFVVVWVGKGAGDDKGIFGQRFSSAGTRLGGEFQVNVYTTGGQTYPSIAVDEAGFVVAWTNFLRDGDDYGVFARRFSSTGAPIASEFQVNIRTTGDQARPSVAMSGGSFVIVWQSPDHYDRREIIAQRFSSTGDPLGEQTFINTGVTGDQSLPSVAMDAQGFVVVWRTYHDLFDKGGIFGRRFDSSGVASGQDFPVNDADFNGFEQQPAVAKDSSGYVVVWEGFDGLGTGVSGRRYDSAGTAQSSEFHVNSDIYGLEVGPKVALGGGAFVTTWHHLVDFAPDLIRARAFESQRVSPLDDLQVNAYQKDAQVRPSVARSGAGFVVVWDANPQDGSGYGIVARRLSLSVDLDVDGNGAVEPLTDTLLALRYAFGFRGAVLIDGAIAGNCTRCDAPAIEAYLAGLN